MSRSEDSGHAADTSAVSQFNDASVQRTAVVPVTTACAPMGRNRMRRALDTRCNTRPRANTAAWTSDTIAFVSASGRGRSHRRCVARFVPFFEPAASSSGHSVSSWRLSKQSASSAELNPRSERHRNRLSNEQVPFVRFSSVACLTASAMISAGLGSLVLLGRMVAKTLDIIQGPRKIHAVRAEA